MNALSDTLRENAAGAGMQGRRSSLSDAERAAALAVACALIELQAGRRKAGLAPLFADPAWDMLLDLFVARGHGRQVGVTSLCIAAGVPASTAHRWIQLLADAGAVRRRADPCDRRRVYIEITDRAAMMIAAELLRHRDRMAQLCS